MREIKNIKINGVKKPLEGKNAYEIALEEGFVGTRAEWLASLKGEKGEKGEDGKPNNYFYEEKGINLFDKTAPRESGFLTGNGQLITTTAYDHATIPVEVGKTYTHPVYVYYTGEGTAVRTACCDKDGVYIGFIEGTLSEDKQYLSVTITEARNHTTGATIDTEIAFVKVSVATQTSNTHHVDNFMFVEGDTYPDTYESYQENAVYLRDDIRVKSTDSILKGKSVVFTGDSICAATSDESGVLGWAERIGVANGMHWLNKGINGATITEGLGKPCIADTDFGESPDYIIMEGGTNDADLIGTYENFTPEKYGSFNMYNYTGEFDKTTFCGAVEHLFKRVTTDYAGAKIGFIIAQKMGSCSSASDYTAEKSRRRFYFETIITLCKKWGIPYLNLWDDCYLCPMNPTHNTSGQNLMYVGDYQHLAKRGYDYVTPIIEAWMRSL